MNIGRERHASDAGQNVLERASVKEFHVPFAGIGNARNFERKLAVHRKPRADSALLPRADENFPFVKVQPLQQQHFHPAAVFGLREHAGGQHPRPI